MYVVIKGVKIMEKKKRKKEKNQSGKSQGHTTYEVNDEKEKNFEHSNFPTL